MKASEFDIAALAARLVARDLDIDVSPVDIARIGLDAMLPYYAQAHAIISAAARGPKQ